MLAGIAAGVTLGVLFAPDKGKKNREKLGNKLHDLGDSIKDTATETIGTILGIADNLSTNIKGGNPQRYQLFDDVEHAII